MQTFLNTVETGRSLKVRLALVALIVGVLAFIARHAQIDDSLIYARYIRNALDGLGLVFNKGERVNALSSPVYSYLVMGAARLLQGNVLAATAMVSGVFFFAACAVAEYLMPLSGLLLAGTGYFYSLVGMESSTFLFMLVLVVLLVQEERYDWLPTAAILLALTRFEGGAMAAVLLVECYRRKKWPSAVAYIPAALIAVAYLALNRYWYGSALPASAGAKLGQGRSGYWGAWPFAFFHGAYQLKPEFLSTVYIVVLVAVFAVPGLWRLKDSALARVALPYLGILLGFYLLFNIAGYKWYFAPFIFFATIYACAMLPRSRAWQGAVAALALLSMSLAARRFSAAPDDAHAQGYPAISRWMIANTSPGVRLEAGEIGTIGWDCAQCNVLDILGLTLPKNADHIAHRDLSSWLAEDHPAFVVVHYASWTFEDVAKQSPDYERVPVDFGSVVYLLRRKS